MNFTLNFEYESNAQKLVIDEQMKYGHEWKEILQGYTGRVIEYLGISEEEFLDELYLPSTIYETLISYDGGVYASTALYYLDLCFNIKIK